MRPIAPQTVGPDAAAAALAGSGWAVLAPAATAAWAGTDLRALAALAPAWDDLPADAHLLDGGRYRRRRHASYVVRDGVVERSPHRAHWQPLEYNALHGGIERWFEPVDAALGSAPAFTGLMSGLARLAAAVRGHQPAWYAEAHPFRIDTAGGIGRPTPEGAHRDGVDLVAVVLVARIGVKGGETRVFDAHGPSGVRFTLTEPWSCLLLDDARVIHETTPIQPLEPGQGHRDTLVVTVRAGGFQEPVGVGA